MKNATKCICCNGIDLYEKPAHLHPFIVDRMELDFSECSTLYCRKCGCCFLDIRFDDDEMELLYSEYRENEYIRLRELYEPGYMEKQREFGDVSHVKELEDFIGFVPERVLDWGGNDGYNTPFKQSYIDIYDINGVSVLCGNKVRTPHPPYDLIVCANVLEHVSYPFDLLADIRWSMDSKTVLCIEVPNENKLGTYWHEHINFFTPLSIHSLLYRCGFEIIKTKQLEVKQYHPYLVLAQTI